MSFFLNRKLDYAAHNAEVKSVWEDFAANRHCRTPIVIGGSIRNFFSNPAINTQHLSFRDFFSSARVQIEAELQFRHYVRHNILCDQEMGLPDAWDVFLNFQNSRDQAWFGAPFFFPDDPADVPDTLEILKEHPENFAGWTLPDPFWGRGDFMKNAYAIYEEMEKLIAAGYEFKGRPVRLQRQLFPGCDGIFTLALKLRGTVECMCDMYEDPVYFHALMDYLTEGSIARCRSHRVWAGLPEKTEDFFYADDSIAMLSLEQYREFVEPYTDRIFAALSTGRNNQLHLCGDAGHLFGHLARRYGLKLLDTGFPIDHGMLRRAVGPEVTIAGGPTIMLLQRGTPEEVFRETRRILQSGVREGKRFLLREANNLAPLTPVENLLALYDAGIAFGQY